MTFLDFVSRYWILLRTMFMNDDREACVRFFFSLKKTLDASRWSIGATKVFYKDDVEISLEALRKQAYYKYAVRIQGYVRGFLGRLKFLRVRQVIIEIQRLWRKQVVGIRAARQLKATIRIQSFMRMLLARKELNRRVYTLKLIQRMIHVRIAQQRVQQLKEDRQSSPLSGRRNTVGPHSTMSDEEFIHRLEANILQAVGPLDYPEDIRPMLILQDDTLPRPPIDYRSYRLDTMHSFDKYMRAFFTHGQGYFTDVPIREPLTNLPSTLADAALECFLCILVLGRALEPVDSALNTMQRLLYLIHEAIDADSLRDEVFCQICMQLIRNDNNQVANALLRLLPLCLRYFPPSAKLEPFLVSFCQDPAAVPPEFQDAMIAKIRLSVERGSRRQKPTYQELISVLNGETKNVTILCADRSSHSHPLAGFTTCADIIHASMATWKATSYSGWALYLGASIFPLEQTMRILDIDATATAKLFKGRTPELALKLYLKKELMDPAEHIKDELYLDLILVQIRSQMKTVKFRAEEELAARYISTLLMTEGKSAKIAKDYLVSNTSDMFRTLMDLNDFQSRVDQIMEDLANMKPLAVKQLCMQAAVLVTGLFGKRFRVEVLWMMVEQDSHMLTVGYRNAGWIEARAPGDLDRLCGHPRLPRRGAGMLSSSLWDCDIVSFVILHS